MFGKTRFETVAGTWEAVRAPGRHAPIAGPKSISYAAPGPRLPGPPSFLGASLGRYCLLITYGTVGTVRYRRYRRYLTVGRYLRYRSPNNYCIMG